MQPYQFGTLEIKSDTGSHYSVMTETMKGKDSLTQIGKQVKKSIFSHSIMLYILYVCGSGIEDITDRALRALDLLL